MAVPQKIAKECCLEVLPYQSKSSLWYDPKVTNKAFS